jgi:hypothetical protein
MEKFKNTKLVKTKIQSEEETEKQKDVCRESKKNKQKDIQDILMERLRDGATETWKKEKERKRKTGRQKDRKTERQEDRNTK